MKLPEAVTDKKTLWSAGTLTSLLTLYAGYQQVGVPAMAGIENHVIEMKNNQTIHTTTVEDVYDITEKVYIAQMTELYLKYPQSKVDSLLERVSKDVFWENR